MSRITIRVWLAGLLMLAAQAFAADLITQRSYVVDAKGTMSWSEVAQQEATPYQGVLSQGYTNAAIWLKLDITPPAGAHAEDELVLRIRPVYLDEIRLFDPLDHSGKNRTVGDTLPFSASEFTSLAHTLVVPAGEQPRTIWLRVKTTSTCLVNVEAMSRDEMTLSELKLHLFYFSVLAVVSVFALLGLINWVNHRDALLTVFVVRQIYFLVYTMVLFGIHRYVFAHVPSLNLDAMHSWIVISATALSLLFEYRFLKEYAPPLWVRFILKSLMYWSATTFVLMFLGYTMVALRATMLLNMVSVVTLLFVAAMFIDQTQIEASKNKVLLGKRIVVGYYFSINVVLAFGLLPLMGLVKGNEFAVNTLIFYTLCSGLIMTTLMQLRANKQKLAQTISEKKLLLSEQAVTLEKSKREEQTHLFHMLMHELKTPLSVIDMAMMAHNDAQTTSRYVSRAVGQMKDILDRCVKADKLTEDHVDIRLSEVHLKAFMADVLVSKSELVVHLVADESMVITTDAQFLSVMLGNLLDNADRYGDKSEAVQILVQRQQNAAGEQGVRITVSNRPNAAGWPDPDMVFKKYYRSAGAEAQSGTGLGLYLVRTLARLLGGDCRYVPNQKHVRFELWLPS